MSDKLLIGAHLSVAKGFANAFAEAHTIGASALQIFAKSPMRARLRTITAEEGVTVAALPNRAEISYASIHSSYLLNFAKKLERGAYQFKSLIEDIRNAAMIGADGAIVHMGKQLALDATLARKLFRDNIRHVLAETEDVPTEVILENTAGQGSEMGWKLEEYAEIFHEAGPHRRLGSCLDTAHLMGAGYDLSDPEQSEATVATIEKLIGWEQVSCVHLNDSKKPAGSRVDRHEDIGYGTVGDVGLAAFVRKARHYRADLPFILETPEGHAPFKAQISRVRGW